MKQEYLAVVLSKKMLNSDTAYITLVCKEIADVARPGQFVSISCSQFLKRPFGIASVDKDYGTFSIGVKIIGEGTAEIASYDEGTEVSVLGPLGNGFDLESYSKYILVSGGTGVFPINFAHEYLESYNIPNIVVQGFREASQVVMSNDSYIVTTDVGDYGIKGNSCDGLSALDKEWLSDSALLCVGPLPMMKAVGKWATDRGLKCFVSMEQRMACGIGICLVCVCKTKAEEEGREFNHVRCCKDGPVFDYEEVVW